MRDGSSECEPSGFGKADILGLLRDLIACDTRNPPGNEAEPISLLVALLEKDGVEATVQDVSPGRQNLVATIAGEIQGSLVFSGHLDTVPTDPEAWRTDPLDAVVDDGAVFGLGAADMKGAVASMVGALLEIVRAGTVPPRDVTLALTAGEEVDSCGAVALQEQGLLEGARAFVIGEPTRMRVGLGHKGALWLAVSAAGRSVHGSRPEAGVNAVELLLDWLTPLTELREVIASDHPILGSATLSVNGATGGIATNVVPDSCTAVLDVRTVPGQDHDEVLTALGRREPQVNIEVLRSSPPVCPDRDHPFVRAASEMVRECGSSGASPVVAALPYVTDGSVFGHGNDAPVIVVGPGDEGQAHVVDEHVRIAHLLEARDLYRELALSRDW